MRQVDVQNLVKLLKEYDNADPIKKAELILKIDKITDNYTDLFALYRLKVAAEKAMNGRGPGDLGYTEAVEDAEYLKKQHDLILSLFQTGKRDEAYAILNESNVVAVKYL